MAENSIVLGKKKFHCELQMLDIDQLNFSTDNPRICCAFDDNPDSPVSQSQIEDFLSQLEHVAQLKISIERNGGIIEPLYVKDGDFIVLEGNSRLAACRALHRENPDICQKLPCRLLPNDIDDEAVFILLGQYHIIGRKDWEPFEQANYLYKRHQKTGMPIDAIADELGISAQKAQKYLQTVDFMLKHDDLNEKHFDCYDSYLTNHAIKKVRQTELNLDQSVVDAVKNEEIKTRSDMRKLTETAKVAVEGDETAKQCIRDIADGNQNIRQAHAQIENSGKLDQVIKKLRKFNHDIDTDDFQSQLTALDHTQEIIDRIDKIIAKLSALKLALENVSNPQD